MSGLAVQRCTSCGSCWFPERLACPDCGSDSFERVVVAEGVVEEPTLVRRAPGRSPDEPVPLATIHLAEGPHVVARLRCDAQPGDRVPLDSEHGGPVAG